MVILLSQCLHKEKCFKYSNLLIEAETRSVAMVRVKLSGYLPTSVETCPIKKKKKSPDDQLGQLDQVHDGNNESCF